ncbi:hypothetical protein GA0115256_11354 [Streptomyces sp. DconLS]|nr:hypothetical protein GA0115256_11354 [Streptomyces sp. DconLS]
MRLSRCLAPLTLAAALALALPYDATPHAHASAGPPRRTCSGPPAGPR